jgi:3',5'-cyclic AMP phosphodiesterase CpdA
MLNIAHISDLHFAKISFSIKQFLSKQWIGNFNNLLLRKFFYSHRQLFLLPQLLKKLNTHYLIITGDFTATSQIKEFELAKEFLSTLPDNNIKILSVPGNHDHYTKTAFLNKRFYKFLENGSPNHDFPTKSYSLKEHGVESFPLNNKWWYLGIDTALATPILSARGLFSEKIEQELINLLKLIPPQINIIVVNHFPFSQEGHKRRILKRGNDLKNILQKNPHVKLYLHGHTHKNYISDQRKNHLPIIIDSGSISSKKNGSFNFLSITNNSINIDTYRWENSNWHNKTSSNFTL